MRIGVIGAGAVGGAVAALLHRGGHEVEVTARGAHLDTILERGIHLRGAWGDYEARVEASARLSGPAELVIVTTKAQDAAAAVAENLDAIGASPVLVVQNGLDAIDAVSAVAPRASVIGGLAMFAASYLSPGSVTITTPGPIWLGGGEAVAQFTRVLSPVLPVEKSRDFASAQWSKLMVNQVNALPAITGLSVQEVIAHKGLRRVLTLSMREGVRVAHALDIRFATLGGLSEPVLRAFAAAPLWAAEGLPRLIRRRMGSTPNPASTLQSIRRGQPTEIDYLNGAVVAAGERVGVPTPVNALLVRMVHEVETSKAFVVPEVVLARVFTAEPVE